MPDLIIATCEGSCNSHEKKYKERRVYEKVQMSRKDGSTYDKRVERGVESTPVTDVLNTLQKMAQKRAYVGAVILATGASDFFNQDIDDPQDAATLGITPKQDAPRVQAKIPGVTAAASQDQTQQSKPAPDPASTTFSPGTSCLSEKGLATPAKDSTAASGRPSTMAAS